MLKFELKSSKRGMIALLTVAMAEAQPPVLERRVARLLSAECATLGFAVRGTINIEVQENWLTTTVDVRAAAFVVATDRTGASTTRRPASSATAASRPPRRRAPTEAIS